VARGIRAGVKVRTKFGEGVVEAVGGDTASVTVPHVGMLRCLLHELVLVGEPAEPKAGVSKPRPLPGRDSEARGALLRSLEALRFGIVPREAIERLTIGYKALESWVGQRLPEAGDGLPTISEICGAFGTGKSHTMAAIRHIAAANNYLTAHVEVDGHGVTLSDPIGLLYHLWSTLTARELESAVPLVELNQRALDRGALPAQTALESYPRVYSNHETIRYLRTHGALEPFEERLDGLMACSPQEPATSIRQDIISHLHDRGVPRWEVYEHVQPTRVVGVGVEGRPEDFVDCLMGYASLARVAGYAGVVVTVDEFEVEHQGSHERLQRIVALAATLRVRFGSEGSRGVPLAVFIATVGEQGQLGDVIVEAMLGAGGGDHAQNRRELRAWPAKNLLDLAGRIHRLYCDTYASAATFDRDEADELADRAAGESADESGQIRAFIKGYLAHLDARLGPPCA